jgi:AraC-like DNA-binding protein
VYSALAALLERYFLHENRRLREAGCKAFLLTLLYHLAGHFSASSVMSWEFLREQQRCVSLKPLFEHISRHSAAKLTVAQASALVHMSQPKMMKTFKRVAGMTLVAYLNHVRISNAAKLLRESAQTIAEVAASVGFADQSYFDKQFKRAFGCTPNDFRQRS